MFVRSLIPCIGNKLRPTGSKRENSSNAVEFPKKIFSGIQPTGAIHLGNYLGAITQWIKLQNEGNDMTLSIVDLHSMTLPHDPKVLSSNVLEMTATLLACGVDPNKVVLFQQSAVPQHTELFWYLGCISTMARLKHLPQFKEKSAKLKDVPLGLYIYPVLQAADILAHKATHVPIGEDQLQHLQLAQELVRMFNSRFGNVFPTPRSMVADTARVRSLRDPTKKMSKSDTDPKSCIYLTDSTDVIINKLKKAVTDFTSEVTYDLENRLGVSNLLNVHAAISGKSVTDICEEVKDLNTAKYKLVVADALESHIEPIRQRYSDLLADPQYLFDVLEDGKEKAIENTERTLKEVRVRLGLQLNVNDKQIIQAQ